LWTGRSRLAWAPATGNTKLLNSYEGPVSKKNPNRKRPPIRQASDLIYGLRYCMGNAGEPGYVHLAGFTDKFWEQNVHVVWDGTQAGEWHPSTLAWKEFIQREVNGQVHTASADGR
jgi:hypothetical protein